MVEICQQHNPNVTFSLEMITRDPLEIPCLKQEYWSTFEDTSGKELARTLRMVKQNKFKEELPRTSQLSMEDKLALEENNIVSCLTYSKNELQLN